MKTPIFLLFWICAIGTSAQTVYVNLNASGNNDGSSWENAFVNLYDALEVAQEGDQIWIAKGEYKPEDVGVTSSFRIEHSISLIGGFNGTETRLDQRVLDNDRVVLSGDLAGDDVDNNFTLNRTDNARHVVEVINGLTDPVEFLDLSITNGHTVAEFDDNDEHMGGAIRSYSEVWISGVWFHQNFGRAGACLALVSFGCNGSLVQNCNFFNNFGVAQSAGIFMSSVRNVDISESTFSGNQVSRGCIYPLNSDDIRITTCVIRNNTCHEAGAYGAGIFSFQSRDVSIDHCEIATNTCGNAAGIYVDGRDLANDIMAITISNTHFIDNSADDYGGAALYTWKANVEFFNSSFVNNTAGNTGGAIYASGTDKTLNVWECQFTGNKADGGWGGAITVHNDSTQLNALGCSFSENEAVTSGGAVVVGFKSKAHFLDCIFETNVASFGGAAYSQNDSSAFRFTDCLFEGNQALEFGGAISMASGSRHDIRDCKFSLNVSNGSGGALHVVDPDDLDQDTALVHIDQCIFEDNIAELRGGAVIIGNADAYVVNSLFDENSVFEDYGGAIFQDGSLDGRAYLELTNNTFYENVGAVVSGFAQFTDDLGSAEAQLLNNIFYHTLSPDYGVEAGSPVLTSLGGNSVDDVGLASLFNGMNDTHGEDPRFRDPDNNDFCLEDDSPCVNTGIAEGAPTTDYFGNPVVGLKDKGYCENQNVVSTKSVLDITAFVDVAPNPTKDQLNIQWQWDHESVQGDIILIDAAGMTIQRIKIDFKRGDNERILRVEDLPSGSYTLLLSTAHAEGRKSFVKL